MIIYSLYAVMAGAVLRVFSAVGISYYHDLGQRQPGHREPHGCGLVDA